MNRAVQANPVDIEAKIAHPANQAIAPTTCAPSTGERRDGAFLASADPSLLDLDAIHDALSRLYWCERIPREVLSKAIAHSLAFGLYDTSQPRHNDQPSRPTQIGFCRIITDRATYGYLADVYILECYRGKRLSNLLLTAAFAHPDLTHVRRLQLMTRDAHHVYRAFGFAAPSNPAGCMEIVCRDMYKAAEQGFPPPPWMR